LKAVILAGGEGTRLRPLTYMRPKPMVPVVGRPFLEYQIDLIKAAGIHEIVLCTSYMAEKVREHFGSGGEHGIRMHYNIEEVPLGTAGAVKDAERYFAGDEIVVFNGDILTDHDLAAVIEQHRSRGATATLTLQPVPRPNPYGVIETAPDGRILAFKEPSVAEKKASSGAVETGDVCDDINAGIYVLDSRVFRDVPSGEPWSFEKQLFLSLIESGAGIYGYRAQSYWLDIGHPHQYLEANRAVLTGDVRTALGSGHRERIFIGEGSLVEGADLVEPVCLGADVIIEPGATVGPNAVVGAGSTVAAGARVTQSVILDDCELGPRSTVEGAILDSECLIAPGAQVRPGSVLGRGSRSG
jgi:NDP-sugar pyrophosphorylase family protein